MKNFIILVFLICASSLDAQQVRVSNKNSSLTVNAGADQSITLPSSATLSGIVIALPKRLTTSINWTVESGPGTVNFANPQAAATTAGFSAPGSYVLVLSASTSRLSASSKTLIAVNAAVSLPPPPITVSMAWDPVASTPEAPVTGYNLWRLNPDGSWTKVYDGPDTTATDATVQAGSTYTYAVRAVNSTGCNVVPCESEPSNFVTVTAQ
jgi:hypothetical protein